MTCHSSRSSDFLRSLELEGRRYKYFSIRAYAQEVGINLSRYPISWKIILENLIRNQKEEVIGFEAIHEILVSFPENSHREIPFYPARLLLQDFTGIPVVVDLAAMRDVMVQWKEEPSRINPMIPVHLVIDHSLQVDSWGCDEALRYNLLREFERNGERYRFLKWAQSAFSNFFVVPPGKGIIHQINIEHLATIVVTDLFGNSQDAVVFPDTVFGTDSHTTMVNSLGILGWGIGGIEAEAVMVGQPYYFPAPTVVGVYLFGTLPKGSSATDVALLITEELRRHGVVGRIVEFFGPASKELSFQDRATIANMAPEYGATMGYFPVDEKTLGFFLETGRSPSLVKLIEKYFRLQGIFGHYGEDEDLGFPENILFERIIEIDLSRAVPSVAGPRRPQDRVVLDDLPKVFSKMLTKPRAEGGYGIPEGEINTTVSLNDSSTIGHGSVVIASITSCTNTSNPELLITAALLARNARNLGLKPKPWVKTSFAPGSRSVYYYLSELGLMEDLEALGFNVVGYGCATCIGNSGPLPESVMRAIKENNLVVAAVISANRNFEGRIHSAVRANFLASPALVVAFALAGRIDIDWSREPIGLSLDGKEVFLKDLMPSKDEVLKALEKSNNPKYYEIFRENLFHGDDLWENLSLEAGGTDGSSLLFPWDSKSTYLRRPSFLENVPLEPPGVGDIEEARVLLLLGDSVTTDHISPAGSIPEDSPAGVYLKNLGVSPHDFNSYGARRGNHEVMIRGTFANLRLKNRLTPERTGGWTVYFPTGEVMTVWEASERYRKSNVPLIIIGGKEYGTGSSRDWAAKGTALLGVRAVIAESFERIHRSNLIGMGVIPLQFLPGESAEGLGITGEEIFFIRGFTKAMQRGNPQSELPGAILSVEALHPSSGRKIEFSLVCRLDTSVEVEYVLHGGILPKVLRSFRVSKT
ncbi:MAG: aconitate hydratase AcnA [Syntrophobacterales bacterium]|nr:aconitate hydratase AcnA [Syntrophobacterales bacterium]